MEELQGIMFIIIRGMLYASGNTHDQLLNCLIIVCVRVMVMKLILMEMNRCIS